MPDLGYRVALKEVHIMVKPKRKVAFQAGNPRVGLVKLKFQSPRPFHGYDITGPWFAQTTATVHKRCHRTFVTGSPIEVSCHSSPSRN